MVPRHNERSPANYQRYKNDYNDRHAIGKLSKQEKTDEKRMKKLFSVSKALDDFERPQPQL